MATKAEKTKPAASADGLELGRLCSVMGFRLRRVQNQLSRDFSVATADHELRSGLFSALALIAANPGVSQNEISREIALDKSVTVAVVDELERRGWAKRKRSKTDRRRHALYATPAGEAQLDELFAIVEQTEKSVLHRFSAAELQLLNALLDRMYAACTRDK